MECIRLNAVNNKNYLLSYERKVSTLTHNKNYRSSLRNNEDSIFDNEIIFSSDTRPLVERVNLIVFFLIQ